MSQALATPQTVLRFATRVPTPSEQIALSICSGRMNVETYISIGEDLYGARNGLDGREWLDYCRVRGVVGVVRIRQMLALGRHAERARAVLKGLADEAHDRQRLFPMISLSTLIAWSQPPADPPKPPVKPKVPTRAQLAAELVKTEADNVRQAAAIAAMEVAKAATEAENVQLAEALAAEREAPRHESEVEAALDRPDRRGIEQTVLFVLLFAAQAKDKDKQIASLIAELEGLRGRIATRTPFALLRTWAGNIDLEKRNAPPGYTMLSGRTVPDAIRECKVAAVQVVRKRKDGSASGFTVGVQGYLVEEEHANRVAQRAQELEAGRLGGYTRQIP